MNKCASGAVTHIWDSYHRLLCCQQKYMGTFRKQYMSNGSYKPFPRSSFFFLLAVEEAWVTAWIVYSQYGIKISHVEGNMGLTVIFKRYLFFALISLRVTNTNTDLHWKQLKLGCTSPAFWLTQTWTINIEQFYVQGLSWRETRFFSRIHKY